jgi:hypothetical protein
MRADDAPAAPDIRAHVGQPQVSKIAGHVKQAPIDRHHGRDKQRIPHQNAGRAQCCAEVVSGARPPSEVCDLIDLTSNTPSRRTRQLTIF